MKPRPNSPIGPTNFPLGTRRASRRIPPGGTLGYDVLLLLGGWNISKNFTVNAAIENLFDADYRTHGSGQNMAGGRL